MGVSDPSLGSLTRDGLREILVLFEVKWEVEFSPAYRKRVVEMAGLIREDMTRLGATDLRSATVGALVGATGIERLVRRAAGGYVPTSVEGASTVAFHSITRLLIEEGGV